MTPVTVPVVATRTVPVIDLTDAAQAGGLAYPTTISRRAYGELTEAGVSPINLFRSVLYTLGATVQYRRGWGESIRFMAEPSATRRRGACLYLVLCPDDAGTLRLTISGTGERHNWADAVDVIAVAN